MPTKNLFKCPQCGAASSTKLSMTSYHCIYCDSSFTVEPDKNELLDQMIGSDAERKKELLEKLAAMKASGTYTVKMGRIIGFIIFFFVVGIGATVFFSVRSALKGIPGSPFGSEWGTPSDSKFAVFSGSKGTVAWFVQEYSRTSLDSAKYVLKIVDPQKKETLKEFNYLPTMTWKESFNSSDFLGNFYPAGDTCWIASEQNGLIARNIYSGDIIVDDKKLAELFPKLSKGISKAEYSNDDKTFELTTNDGFEYRFRPSDNSLNSKDDLKKEKHNKDTERTFFILTEGNRPALFKSTEKVNAAALHSQLYPNDFDNNDPKTLVGRYGNTVTSITPLLPDQAFFNGVVAYADDKKAIVLYQNGIGKKSGMIISCISAEGKELWKLSGNDVAPLADVFADTKNAIDNSYAKNTLVLYFQRASCYLMAIDINTGKVIWKYDSKN